MPEVVKAKPVQFRKIPEVDEQGRATRWYEEMRRLIGASHPGLVEHKIVLFWKRGWKPDKDNRLLLGQAIKVSDEDRQVHGYQGKIRLNEEWFHDPGTLDLHKIAVLDHELCHFERELDSQGDTRYHEDGHPCIRMVKHDVEEFKHIIDTYGLYTDNLRVMAASIHNAQERERGGNNAPAIPTPPDNPNNNEEDDLFETN